MTGRRPGSRTVATALVLLGVGAVLLSAGRPWAQAIVDGVTGPTAVRVVGRLAAPATTALGLVAAAGAVVLAISGRVVRAVVAGLLVLTGLAVAGLSVAVAVDPGEALRPAVSTATGTAGSPLPDAARATPWPLISGVGGLLVTSGAVVALLRGLRWQDPSRRFDRADPVAGTTVAGASTPVATRRPQPAKDARLDAWDRLSAGEDPTE